MGRVDLYRVRVARSEVPRRGPRSRAEAGDPGLGTTRWRHREARADHIRGAHVPELDLDPLLPAGERRCGARGEILGPCHDSLSPAPAIEDVEVLGLPVVR